MKPRITLSVTSDGQLEIWLNEKGRDLLVAQLQALNERNDHIHLAEPSAMFGDIDLSILAYDAKDTIFKYGKIYFRTDEWDRQYFPHVMRDEPSDSESAGVDSCTGIAQIIRLKNFKMNDDVLLLVSNQRATRWLADGFGLLASQGVGSEAMVVGNGELVGSPDHIEIRFSVIADSAESRLIEGQPNRFSWWITDKMASSFSEKCSKLCSAVERANSSGGFHQYLDPENSPLAPVFMISLQEYSLENLLNERRS